MNKLRGFEVVEETLIGLVNVDRCESCECLINFNGRRPETCPHCNGATRKEGSDDGVGPTT